MNIRLCAAARKDDHLNTLDDQISLNKAELDIRICSFDFVHFEVGTQYCLLAGLPQQWLRGRNFNQTDKPVGAEPGQPPPSHRTVMLSSALAKLLFSDENPWGKHTLLWKGQGGGLDDGPALTVYLPYRRVGVPSEFVLETRGNPMAVVPAVRGVIKRLDPNLPLADIRTSRRCSQPLCLIAADELCFVCDLQRIRPAASKPRHLWCSVLFGQPAYF